jgi:hypothetical protein
MKGAQVGVTEAAINRALYTIDGPKRDVLYVLPTAMGASDFSKSRFGGALDNSPYLKSIFTDTNAVNIKRARANTLYIRGSRGRGNLKSVPVSELVLDELDEMDQQQLWLALERLSGQVHKHVWGISTPTVPEYGIHKLYNGSTQEHFFFRCPCCGRRTELIWPDCIEIVGEHTTDARCNESFIKCKECKGKLAQEEKPNFLSDGEWVSTAPNSNPDVRGFNINQLYSFTVSPAELVVAYFRGFGDELAAKEFHNSKLGQPFIGDGAKVTDDMIARSIRDYTMESPRPRRGGERLITVGCDQGKTCYIVVCEWIQVARPGKDLSAAYKCRVLWVGKASDAEVWKRLGEQYGEWQVLYGVIDADPEINAARAFCRKFDGYAAITRYRTGVAAREINETEKESGAPMLTVDRTDWLTASLGRFKTDPTRIELPRDIPDEFKEHIKNLVSTYERVKDNKKDKETQPVKVFVNTGPDHFAHALTYAEIALQFAPHTGSRPLGKIM